jgi:biopolymer transport protein ExbD
VRFKRHIELEQGLKQIEIVPLVNTVFLLLIFFLLTSSFIIQPGIKVYLPKAASSEVLTRENIEITISGENIAYFDGKVISGAELKNLINQAAKRNQVVLVKADRHASLGKAVEIWDMCRLYGVVQVNMATNQQ